MTFSEIMLLLFVMNLGVALGAGIYETFVVLPLWFQKTPQGYRVDVQAMQKIDTGRKFWGFVTTIPLTLLTIVNLFIAWHSTGPNDDFYLAALLITLAERIATFAFFIPIAIKLQKSESLASSKTSRLISRWKTLNYGRLFLTLVGWLAALFAFSSAI